MQVSATLNTHWLLLKDLSTEEKLSLIELLVKSLQGAPVTLSKANQKQRSKKSKPSTDSGWVYRFAGSWNDFPETAEELIALIEKSRTFGREIEML
jgi:hypothetical protein